VGLRFVELLAPGARIFHETHYQPLLHMHGVVDELSLDMLRADGTTLPALVNAVLDRDHQGNPLIIRVAVFDATERHRYEQELLDARRRAEESELQATRIAQTLQQTLMPPRDPQVPGIEIAAAFRPAGSGSEIGGDFYDVFEVRNHDWVISIGDVVGKGIDAAVVANLARYTIRALFVAEESPAEVLRQLNEVVYNHSSNRFCTVALVRLHRVRDDWQVTLSLGGHPAPLLRDGRQEPHEVGEPGSLVGAFEVSTHSDMQFELRRDMTVVLYTDGVTEARHGPDFYGESRLRQLLMHEDFEHPDRLTNRVLNDVLEFQDHHPRDDIALIAFRIGRSSHHHSAEFAHRPEQTRRVPPIPEASHS